MNQSNWSRRELAAFAVGAGMSRGATAATNLKIVARGIVHDASTAAIGGACRCLNGHLLATFNTGGDLGAGQRTGVVRSTDGGKTWSAPETFFESAYRKGGIEAGCTLTCLKSGRVLLPYADGFYLQPKSKNYDRNALQCCPLTDDHGKTWTNRKAQSFPGYEPFAFGRVVELPNGTLLMPLWGAYEKRGAWSCGLLKSTGNGESWGDYRRIVQGDSNETPIILLPDARVLALIRGHADDATRHSTWRIPPTVETPGPRPYASTCAALPRPCTFLPRADCWPATAARSKTGAASSPPARTAGSPGSFNSSWTPSKVNGTTAVIRSSRTSPMGAF